MASRETSSGAQKRTISEDVYRALKRDVITLRHPPGAALREQDLAALYGSSRVPVREACGRLQQEGLVDSVPYRGYFAKRISLKEIAESFDLRLVLETHAAVLATERASPEDIDRLEALGAVEYTPRDPDSYEAFLDRNLAFHVEIAEVAGNARLTRVLKDLLESMQRYFFLGLDLGDFGMEMREEHERLTGLMREGDTAAVAECVKSQIEESRNRILKALVREGMDLPVE